MQWFKPSSRNPKLSTPTQTQDETPLFLSSMKIWGFPLLSTNASSNTLDSTTNLLPFLLLRSPSLSSVPSPLRSRILPPSRSRLPSRSRSLSPISIQKSLRCGYAVVLVSVACIFIFIFLFGILFLVANS